MKNISKNKTKPCLVEKDLIGNSEYLHINKNFNVC